ncbi:MAG: hypothetical protein GY799_11500, partial [Desulfobulbaceae bacterium]|nr:hypothetical protein [Desulfobulbaceae bacterium]
MTMDTDVRASTGVLIEEPESAPYIRHPADLARLIAGVGLMALGVVAALVVEDAVTGFERDLVGYFAGLNDGLEHFLVGLVQLAIVTIPLVGTLFLVIARRWRALGYTYLAAIVAGNLD